MRYVDLMHSVPVRPVLNMPQLPGTQAPTVAALGRLIERNLFQLLVRKEPLEVLDDTLCAVEAVDTSLLIDKVVDRFAAGPLSGTPVWRLHLPSLTTAF